MNTALMEQIVQHVFANLGLISAAHVRHSQSIIDKSFRLPDKKLSFFSGSQEVHRAVYGAQVQIGDKEFKILAGDCSQDKNTPEYCVIIQLTGLPAYGMYMVCDPESELEALIAVTVNNRDWMPCTTFLQATVLAAMEQLRDIGAGWQKCTNYQDFYETLVAMIKFHTNYYEEANEGQETKP